MGVEGQRASRYSGDPEQGNCCRDEREMEECRRRPEHLTGRLGLGRQEVAACLVGTVSSAGSTATAGVAAPLLLLRTTGLWRNWQARAVDVGQGIALSGAVCDRGGRQGPRSGVCVGTVVGQGPGTWLLQELELEGALAVMEALAFVLTGLLAVVVLAGCRGHWLGERTLNAPSGG